MPGLPGGSEWILIGLVVLLLFGGERLPELMRNIGKGVGEMKRAIDEGKQTLIDTIHHESNQSDSDKK